MAFDLETYNATKHLTGGPIFAPKHEPLPHMEPSTDEQGNVTRSGAIAYLIAYGVAAAALAYWFSI